MSNAREFRDVRAQAAVAAQAKQQRQTCDGCAFLRGLRPKCENEQSSAYRQPRESFHDRCGWYAVRGHQAGRAA